MIFFCHCLLLIITIFVSLYIHIVVKCIHFRQQKYQKKNHVQKSILLLKQEKLNYLISTIIILYYQFSRMNEILFFL